MKIPLWVCSTVKPVAASADVDQVPRLSRRRLQLFSQIGDMRINHAVGDERSTAPDRFNELMAAESGTGRTSIHSPHHRQTAAISPAPIGRPAISRSLIWKLKRRVVSPTREAGQPRQSSRCGLYLLPIAAKSPTHGAISHGSFASLAPADHLLASCTPVLKAYFCSRWPGHRTAKAF